MYFITKRDSATGKKFAELDRKLEGRHNAQKAFIEKYGAVQWKRWDIGGAISLVLFPEGHEVDVRLWRSIPKRGGWVPNKRTKAGKALEREMDALPQVQPWDINDPVGVDAFSLSHIGYHFGNEEYYGFVTPGSWKDFVAPSDCEEITSVRWKELFDDKTEQK